MEVGAAFQVLAKAFSCSEGQLGSTLNGTACYLGNIFLWSSSCICMGMQSVSEVSVVASLYQIGAPALDINSLSTSPCTNQGAMVHFTAFIVFGD